MEDRNIPAEGVLLIGYFEIKDANGNPTKRIVHGPVTDLVTSQYLLREAEAQVLAHLLRMNVHVPPAGTIAAPTAPPTPGALTPAARRPAGFTLEG